jgi:hypothetical protein
MVADIAGRHGVSKNSQKGQSHYFLIGGFFLAIELEIFRPPYLCFANKTFKSVSVQVPQLMYKLQV